MIKFQMLTFCFWVLVSAWLTTTTGHQHSQLEFKHEIFSISKFNVTKEYSVPSFFNNVSDNISGNSIGASRTYTYPKSQPFSLWRGFFHISQQKPTRLRFGSHCVPFGFFDNVPPDDYGSKVMVSNLQQLVSISTDAQRPSILIYDFNDTIPKLHDLYGSDSFHRSGVSVTTFKEVVNVISISTFKNLPFQILFENNILLHGNITSPVSRQVIPFGLRDPNLWSGHRVLQHPGAWWYGLYKAYGHEAYMPGNVLSSMFNFKHASIYVWEIDKERFVLYEGGLYMAEHLPGTCHGLHRCEALTRSMRRADVQFALRIVPMGRDGGLVRFAKTYTVPGEIRFVCGSPAPYLNKLKNIIIYFI